MGDLVSSSPVRQWVRGRFAQIIAGSDRGSLGEAPPPPEAAAPEAPAEPAEPAAAEPPETAEAPPDADRPLEALSQPELVALAKKLKDENVSKKEKYRPLEEAFAGFNDHDRANFTKFAQLIASDNPADKAVAANWMRDVLEDLSPAEQAKVAAAAEAAVEAEEPGSEFDPFDPEQFDARVNDAATKIVEARERAAAEAKALEDETQKILGEMDDYVAGLATTVGIPELTDKGSVEFQAFLTIANNTPGNGYQEKFTAAAEKLQATFATRAQAYMKEKSAAAGAPAAAPEGGAPSGSSEPKTKAEARASALSRLEKMGVGPGV